MGKLFKKPSLKKTLGVTKAKRKISKATRVPTTKSGRKKKAKSLVTKPWKSWFK